MDNKASDRLNNTEKELLNKFLVNNKNSARLNELASHVDKSSWTPDDVYFLALYDYGRLDANTLRTAKHDSPVIRYLKTIYPTGGRKSKRQRLRRSKSRRRRR